MNRLIILIVSVTISFANAFCEEFTVTYNEGTITESYITYRTIDDAPGTVEVIHADVIKIANLSNYNSIEIMEIPSTASYEGNAYTVTTLNCELAGMRKLVIPSTVRWIKSPIHNHRNSDFDSSIIEVVIDNAPIEELCEDLFAENRDLKSVSFGNACIFKEIPAGAFAMCTSLKSVTVPESVEIIGEEAFVGCAFETIALPPSLNIISRYAFYDCQSLKKIEYKGDNLKFIKDGSFYRCTALESINIESDVLEEIGSGEFGLSSLGAFENCSSLKWVNLSSANIIWHKAFKGCKELKTVTIGKESNLRGSLDIKYEAFSGCENLSELVFSSFTLTNIDDWAFRNCTSLRDFTLDANTNIGSGVFSGCNSIESFNVVGEGALSAIDGVLMRNTKNEWNELIRLELISYPCGRKDNSYVMPDDVNYIYPTAFEGVINLQELYISSKVTEIGLGMFRNSTSLRRIYGGDNIQRIESGAFNGAINLQEVSLLKNVSELGVMVFSECKALKHVELPSGLNHIPSGTFSGCTSLENVNIPDTYVYIGKSAFHDCSALQEVKLPTDLKVIGESAFVNCSKIESIHLPENVTEIRTNTFRNCEALESITLPASLDTICYAALQGCKALKSINLPESLKGLQERAFKGCESLTTLVIPDAVTEIGTNAFEDCISLKEVKVGNGVKGIGQWAFYDCTAMEKLTLGSSLETIGAEAFDGDINIRDITCLSVNPPSFPGGFPVEVMENATVTVPEGSEFAYNCDPIWDPMVEGEVQKAESIELNFKKIELQPKESVDLVAVVLPEDAVDRSVIWSSDDYFVAKVDENGVVTAVNYGSAKITATASNGVKAICSVTVKDKSVPVESISLNMTETDMEVGESVTLTATVMPENASDKSVTWSSDNPEVATVTQEGLVTAMMEGETQIWVNCIDQPEIATFCWVTVTQDDAVEINTADNLTIKVERDEINIYGKSADTIVLITDMEGRIIRRTNESVIRGIDHGVYIVKIDKYQLKVYI